MKATEKAPRRSMQILKKLGIAVIWFAIWQLCYLAVREDLLLVSPLTVLKRLTTLLPTAEFWLVVGNSCLHILAGFLLGLTAGCLFAILSARFSWFCAFLSPAMTIIKSTPVASFIILALVWITSKNLSIFISFLLVLPMVYSNLLEGVRKTDPKLLEMAAVYRMPPLTRLRHIYIPQIAPYFFSACTTGVGFAWKSGIAAEILAVPKNAVGTMLYHAKIYLETADLFAWTAVVILLSLLFEKLLVYFIRLGEKRLSRVRTKLPSGEERRESA